MGHSCERWEAHHLRALPLLQSILLTNGVEKYYSLHFSLHSSHLGGWQVVEGYELRLALLQKTQSSVQPAMLRNQR